MQPQYPFRRPHLYPYERTRPMTLHRGLPQRMPGMGQPHHRPRGGLLSRLFGRTNRAVPPQPFGFYPPGAQMANRGPGQILNAFGNPNSIQNFLTNTQKVLNTVQQVGPIVQQYGPLVRNLPAMWKLYKGFKSIKSEEEENKIAKEEVETGDNNHEEKSGTEKQGKAGDNPSRNTDGKSVPKLYIDASWKKT